MFKGAIPHRSAHVFGQSLRCVSSWAGQYYLVAPKKYGLWSFTSKLPFREFMVSPEWIFNLVQAGKMDFEPAKEQLIRCGKGLVRRLADLEKWHACKQEIEMIAHADRTQLALRGKLAIFQKYDVVQHWLAASTNLLLNRKKFLVITGPSGVGKSQYVRSLFPHGAVHELNCAGLKHVCLAGFNPRKHQCIFWDELPVSVIVANRKVFQHPACWVDLGHSPTGGFVSRYWLNDAVSVVATNRWGEDLQSLKSYTDRCWVEENAVVLVVTEPMWISQDSDRPAIS
jgi:hypothetical protein